MKLSEMRDVLAERGIQLTKSLGQNFLHDGNQLRRIVEAAELTKADKVLEVGPGLGPLTELLLAEAGEVLAIEKDARLVEVLRQRFNGASGLPGDDGVYGPGARLSQPQQHNLETGAPDKFTPSPSPPAAAETAALQLIHADALEFLRDNPRDWSDWKLVSNLPYSVASPILVELALSAKRPERLVATLQLEVARRLMAQAGDADYGVLTLLIQLDYELRDWFKIPPSCFFPAPDVDSACVVLVRRATPLLPEAHRKAFVKIVKRAFSQRRKMMLKLLKADWPLESLKNAFAEIGLSFQVRAEAISVDEVVALVEHLTHT